MVAVACFLPGRAKDLSAPRYYYYNYYHYHYHYDYYYYYYYYYHYYYYYYYYYYRGADKSLARPD